MTDGRAILPQAGLAYLVPRQLYYLDAAAFALGALIVIQLSALLASGWFNGETAPDTLGYQVPLTWPDAFAGVRHPLYAAFLWLVPPIGANLRLIAIAQMGLHVVAVIVLFREARRYGLRPSTSFALAASALLSQSVFFSARLAIPEAPAISCLIIAVAAMLRYAGSDKRSPFPLIWIGVFCGIACFLRPIFLAAIPVMPVMTAMLARLKHRDHVMRRAMLVLLAAATPFIIQSAFRLYAVGEFNLVSGGGYLMSGTAALMLDEQHIGQYPANLRSTAEQVLRARTEAEIAGRVRATPLNSSGHRSFISAAFGYYDIYARTFDDVLKEIRKLQLPEESWISFNKRMQNFSVITATILPDRWLAWVVGGASRVIGRSTATNIPFVLFMMAALAVWLIRFFTNSEMQRATYDTTYDWHAVAIIAFGWMISAIVVAVVIIYPATRYIETAAMFLPAIPLLWLIRLVSDRRTPPTS